MNTTDTRRILLVEDEKAIRDAVAAYLERENYWVTAVGDGQDALDEFGKHHFDLVVLDLMLPRVPGERVCRVIRDNSDVPLIMLTAKGEVEDRIIGLEPTTIWSSRSRRASWSPASGRCFAASMRTASLSARFSSSASSRSTSRATRSSSTTRKSTSRPASSSS